MPMWIYSTLSIVEFVSYLYSDSNKKKSKMGPRVAHPEHHCTQFLVSFQVLNFKIHIDKYNKSVFTE